MKMTYRDGRTGTDNLFDQSDAVQRAQVAACMGLDPSASESWPMDAINNLIAIRRLDGQSKFYRELGRMLSPSHS